MKSLLPRGAARLPGLTKANAAVHSLFIFEKYLVTGRIVVPRLNFQRCKCVPFFSQYLGSGS